MRCATILSISFFFLVGVDALVLLPKPRPYEKSLKFVKYRRIPRSQNHSMGCILPQQPIGGRFEVHFCSGTSCDVTPGQRVVGGTFLALSCEVGYALKGNQFTGCLKDKWYLLPTCVKTCPQLSSHSVDIVYEYQSDDPSRNPTIFPGTNATLNCKRFYKLYDAYEPGYRKIHCLDGGVWNRPLFNCTAECGKSSQAVPYIVDGSIAQHAEFPWHVGIYKRRKYDHFEQICGGTLVRPDLIVSAAHCFYDEKQMTVISASEFAVAAGKMKRSYNESEPHAQTSFVKKINIDCKYYGRGGNFALDIALVRTETSFVYTVFVRPICIDVENKPEDSYLWPGREGKVAGWGINENDKSSVELRKITLPYIPHRECINAVPFEFEPFVFVKDKFCAGYLNGSSVCKGDSGGGLCFNTDGLWYLRGIVSVGPAPQSPDVSCESNYYTVFTDVSKHMKWIRGFLASSESERRTSCTLPEKPSNGSIGLKSNSESMHAALTPAPGGEVPNGGSPTYIREESNVPADLTTAPNFEDSESATASGRATDSQTEVLFHPEVSDSSSENTPLGSGSGSALDNEGVEKDNKSLELEYTVIDEKYGNSSSKISQETNPDGYIWVAEDFSECNATCGGALGPNDEGFHMACENNTFDCCDDGSTPAHGPNKEGCCLTSPHKCCPDNVRPALGPDSNGCGCQFARYGCCPDNTTTARGPNNEGCGCDYSPHGCCPDRITTARGPNFEGCPCHTYQFGCCPDGISVARGPLSQDCGCENTEFKCCSDGVTPANGENYAGCTCDASKYGCCPDGVQGAQGGNFEGCLRVPATSGAACALEKDRGTCSNLSVRWFFDTEYGGCSRFWYGGCDGNENQFRSLEECKEVCVKPEGRDACFLPKIAGPCEGYNALWYYDSERRQCGQFIYTGCLGNANRFKTREDCEELCIDPDDVDPCEQPKEVGPCEGNFARWYFNKQTDSCEEFTYGGCKANKNNFATRIACQQQCIPPGRSHDSCSLPREEGTGTEKQARWSFDQTKNRCMPFYYTGCGGNGNNYETEEACNTDCPAKIEQDTCLLPAILGECHNDTQRWYYDSYDQRCRLFYYGGCGGNGNNFGDKASCEKRCRKSTDSSIAVTTTTTTTTNAPIAQSPPENHRPSPICLAPSDPGPCNKDEIAYFYDVEKGSCQAFLYGGCEGNANRFRTIEQCERLCGSFQGQDVCNVPVDQGPCRAAFPKFHYDPITRTCQQFIWGGCEGSANRFSSEEECETVCVHREEPPTGTTSNSAICKEPVNVGSCAPGKYWRYYYNDERQECLSFIWTGCGGNRNRFKSYDACRTTCLVPAMNEIDVGPEPTNTCELARAECDAIRCQFGKEQYVDSDDCTRCRCVDPCLDKNCTEGTKCAIDRLYRGDVVEPQAVCRPTLKPGNCPKLWNSTTCEKECESDADCTGDFKCCSLGCGSSCLEPAPTEPITTPVPTFDRVPYPGAVPARVEPPEEPNIRAQEGGYVVMKCVASGNPRPVVTWRKGVTLIDNSVSRYSVTDEGSLEIIDLYSMDAGTYTCTVDNHVAAPVRIQYELDITAPHPHDPVIIGDPDHRVTVSLNSPATLECRVWGWPRPVTTWWHESRILPISDTQYHYQRDHSLRIQRVSLVDLGVYTCHAFNGIRKPASWSVTLQAPGPVHDVNLAHQQYLQYLIEPQRKPSPPNVIPPPLCISSATAEPPPEPRTYAPYNPEERPPVPSDVIDPSIRLGADENTAPVKVNISVDSGPFPAGSKFSIDCNVEGFPDPAVTWYKDDIPIQPDNRIRIYEANRLAVTNAVKSDAGSYRCEAVNQYSRDDKSVEITVEGIYISPFCEDSPHFVNCALIVKGKYCHHPYYAKFCCRLCTEAGQLPGRTLRINDARRKRRSLSTFL